MSGLTEVTEATMIAAHKAGQEYWNRNKPEGATPKGIASLARSRGWHDDDCASFIAGFFGAKRRWMQEAKEAEGHGELKEQEAKRRFLRLALELEMMQANDMGILTSSQVLLFHKAAEDIRRLVSKL